MITDAVYSESSAHLTCRNFVNDVTLLVPVPATEYCKLNFKEDIIHGKYGSKMVSIFMCFSFNEVRNCELFLKVFIDKISSKCCGKFTAAWINIHDAFKKALVANIEGGILPKQFKKL